MKDTKTSSNSISFLATQIKPYTVLPTMPRAKHGSIKYKNKIYFRLGHLADVYASVTPQEILDVALRLNATIYFNDSTELLNLYLLATDVVDVGREISRGTDTEEVKRTVAITIDKRKTHPTSKPEKPKEKAKETPKEKTENLHQASAGYEYRDGVKTIMVDNCEYVSVRSWANRYGVSPNKLLSEVNRMTHVGFFQKPWGEKFVLKTDVVRAFNRSKLWGDTPPAQHTSKKVNEPTEKHVSQSIKETSCTDTHEDAFYASVYTGILNGEEYVGVKSLADFCKLNSSTPLKTIINKLDIHTVFDGNVNSFRGRKYISKKDAITVVNELMLNYKISYDARKWVSHHSIKDEDKARAVKPPTPEEKTAKRDKTDALIDVINALREALDQLIKNIK